MRNKKFQTLCGLLFFSMMFVSLAHASLLDTYYDNFDSRQDGSTVDGVDYWSVTNGNASDALTVSGTTSSGSGNALKLLGSSVPVDVSRGLSYGNMSPTWVEYVVKPGLGLEQTDVPSSGILAVNFNYNGSVLVADGSHWVDTGQTFTSNTWYRVIFNIDFSTHTYSVYVSPAATTKSPFIPDKEHLAFIDSSINTLSKIGFRGSYNSSGSDTTYVDEMIIHFVKRLQITTVPQTIVKSRTSGLITVQLQNVNGELQTAWRDLTLELKSSSGTGEFSLDKDAWVPISQVIIPEGAQSVSFFYKDFTEGQPTLTVNEFPDCGWDDALQAEKIVIQSTFYDVSLASPQIAGAPFNVQITAKDSNGNVDPLYHGTVDIATIYTSPGSGSKIANPSTASGFNQGILNLSMTYSDAGSIQLQVSDQDDSSNVGSSGSVLFIPATFNLSAANEQKVSKSFPLTVTAITADGQVATHYSGPTILSVVGVNPLDTTSGSLTPSSVVSQDFSNGIANLSETYNRWGVIQIKASDSAYPNQSGLSSQIHFSPSTLEVSIKPPSDSRTFFYVGETLEVTVALMDQQGLPIYNFQGTVQMSVQPTIADIPSTYHFVTADHGKKTFIFSLNTPGNYKVQADDATDGLSSGEKSFEIVEAAIQVLSTAAPVGTTQVELELVDNKGKRIRGDHLIPMQILFEEENENGSVFLSSPGKPILFHDGVARIVVGDSESETVSLSATSSYGFKVKKGTVTFGRVGKGGVGTLLLRETKDE